MCKSCVTYLLTYLLCPENMPFIILPASPAPSHPRLSLSIDACTMLVHAFVSSRLDYCNSLLAGISDELVNKLQSVLHSAARLILGKRNWSNWSNWSNLGWSASTHDTGSPSNKESSIHSGYWSTSVCMVWLRHIPVQHAQTCQFESSTSAAFDRLLVAK